ncbi:MAG: hypothetical protein K2N60_02325 [Oscillospiraceae bacterium]|nr:hypothetical protein [Oscillospiraceae bacterium]
MKEVQKAVADAAKALYKEYVKMGLSDTPAFNGACYHIATGSQWVRFKNNGHLLKTGKMQIPQIQSTKGFAGNEIGGDKGIRIEFR